MGPGMTDLFFGHTFKIFAHFWQQGKKHVSKKGNVCFYQMNNKKIV